MTCLPSPIPAAYVIVAVLLVLMIDRPPAAAAAQHETSFQEASPGAAAVAGAPSSAAVSGVSPGPARVVYTPAAPSPEMPALPPDPTRYGTGAGHMATGLIEEAVRAYQEDRARPPVIAQGLSRRVPYGHRKPSLKCNQLITCLVLLQPGEAVRHTVAGDPENWAINLASTGPGGITPVVVVKPVFPLADLRTNLFVMTDRRVYEVMLEAEKKAERTPVGDPSRLNILEFYYPDEMVQRWQVQETRRADEQARVARASTVQNPIDLTPRIPLSAMHHGYEWKRDKRFPWEPVDVFDDGAHVYITLGPDARHEARAALFLRGLDGSNTMMEYTVRAGKIITDRVFEEAVFIYSEPGRRKKPKQYRLVIKNTRR